MDSVDEKIESIEEIKEKVNVSDIEVAEEDAKEDAAEPSETQKKEVKPKKKTLTAEEKRAKKKASNKTYYVRTREKLGKVEEEADVTPSPKAKPAAEVKYVPSSPRTRMIEAYREARLQDQERKQQRYASWFQ